jgi:hypothetical protein
MADMISTDGQLLAALRNSLQPKGTAPIVCLHLQGARFMNADFISKCLNELETAMVLGNTLNSMERLALEVMLDSAYLDTTTFSPIRTDDQHKLT